MSAATANTMRRVELWTYHDFTLTSGLHAYKGTFAVVDTATATGNLEIGNVSTATQVLLGIFDDECDASSAAKTCRVNFLRERRVVWFGNYGSITAASVGALCYIYTNQDVTTTASGHSPAGMILAVDSTKGVAVDIDVKSVPVTTAPTITDFTNATHGHTNNTGGGVLAAPAITSFASATHDHTNNAGGGVLAAPAITSFASATHTHASTANGGTIRRANGGGLTFVGGVCTISTPGNWTYYTAPAAATTASTIVFGSASAVAGDEVIITSAGTATQTMTYYDGTYARTAALSASKSHRVVASFDGSIWAFSYTVGAA